MAIEFPIGIDWSVVRYYLYAQISWCSISYFTHVYSCTDARGKKKKEMQNKQLN